MLDDSSAFEIRGGRHPVVEQALKSAKAGAFIENDCVLVTPRPDMPAGFDEMAEARVWLVTGPNMAGKSTFLRQNALIAVLAQMGSFVPARSAHIGVIDRLFSRVGAADDLARGRSTFMVEMVETAGILNQATERSLVILDEIGRGTATFDGLSIAWAVVEYLHEVNRCRALFATHYHELTVLAGRLAGHCQRHHGRARVEGRRSSSCTRSSRARPTAAMASRWPSSPACRKQVTKRAFEVLRLLEKADRKAPDGDALLGDLPLFAAATYKGQASAQTEGEGQPEIASPLDEALAALDPDDLSPKAAIQALYHLKELAARKG